MGTTRRCFAVTLMSLAFAGAANGQGNLSMQGFGYPLGQLGSRALSLGGAIGETDAQSAINPATPMLWGAPVLFGQYDPEFRRVRTPAGTARTMTARFPGVGVAVPLGERFAASLGVSTYLDRTWATLFERMQVVGTDTVPTTYRTTSDGAINDVRLAIAYRIGSSFNIGLGVHAFTGENRIVTQQNFPDTVRFSGLGEAHDISYGGSAVSGGFEARIGSTWQFGAAVRRGGGITAEAGDTLLSRARIPLRAGAGISYAGIQGATFSVRAAYEEWSSLRPLGTENLTAFDAWDFGAGAEVTGPRIGRRLVMLRAGGRQRTLPFGAAGTKVDEFTVSTGLGIPIAVDRAILDVGVARATRKADGLSFEAGDFVSGGVGGVRETAYILSFGLRVRP